MSKIKHKAVAKKQKKVILEKVSKSKLKRSKVKKTPQEFESFHLDDEKLSNDSDYDNNEKHIDSNIEESDDEMNSDGEAEEHKRDLEKLKRKKDILEKVSMSKLKRSTGKKTPQEFESLHLDDEKLSIDSDYDNNEKHIDSSIEESDDEMNSEDEAEKHKRDLEKLKQSDPEFYKFLQENDKKLLEFNLSDEENEGDLEDDEDVKGPHKPSGTLDVASDESDFEDEKTDKPKDERIITLKMLKKWQSDIQTDKTNKSIITLIEAFHAALFTIKNHEEEEEPPHYKVEGSAIFNGVIQLCVLELGPAVKRFLGLKQGSKQPPHKCKKFIKIKRPLKTYFSDILKLLLAVTSANIQNVLLKHLHYMASMLISYPNITRSIVKRLITLWGTADDSVRVIAFFCILRITNNQQSSILDTVLKSMYLTYVKNSKFVSLNNLAAINFMRRSLVEMFNLDTNVSYQHVFLYIRQLAIHLRNAITSNKKENIQAVYNFQFVNSLRLWGNLLTVTHNKSHMQQLVYPFVQVCLGTIKLIPTAQYYPLRFHIVQILMELERDTGVFIPVLPFLLEVLTSYDFNKKHKKVSMKPLHFTCLLRLSKSQLQENGFKDTVIETIYGQLLEYLAAHSHSIAFPDLTLLCVIQIKQFLKKCKNSNYNRKFKQILEKIDQNCQFIERERSKVTFAITNFKQIEGWEMQIKNKGTPLSTYFESWHKVKTIKKNKQLTNNDQLADYKLPTINRVKRTESKKIEGKVELFPSDSEDEDETKEKKSRRGKRGGKKINKKVIDITEPVGNEDEKDIVEDINMEDW